MPRSRYQYQSSAEPVSTRASIWIDRWKPDIPDQRAIVKVGLAAAILAGSFFYAPVPRTWATLDRWHPKVEDYQYVKPRLPAAITAGSFFGPVTFKQDVRIDRFEPKIHDGRMWTKPGLLEAIQAGSYVAPRVMQPAPADFAGSLSLHNIKRFQYQSVAGPVLVTPWSPPGPTLPEQTPSTYPDIVRAAPPLSTAIQAGSFFFNRYFPKLEYVYSDKWTPTYPDRFPPKAELLRAIQSGSFFVGDIPRIPVLIVGIDKWGPTYLTVVNPKAVISRAIQSGSFVFVEEGPVRYETTFNIDKWHPEYPDMLRRKLALSEAIMAGSFFPLPDIPRPVAGGIYVYIWKRIA